MNLPGILLFSGSCYVCLHLVGCGGGIGDNNSADPVLDDTPIVYVQRSNLVESVDNGAEILYQLNKQAPAEFFPGAQLMFRPNTGINTASEHLFQTKLCDRLPVNNPQFQLFCFEDRQVKPYDVKDLSVSFDGQKLLFAMRPPAPESDDDPVPTWDIWQFDLQSDSLTSVISSAAVAAIGDDVAPAFLPDGDIIFASSLQQSTRALLLDEGKSQYQGLDEARRKPAMVLHRMTATGDAVQQLTFNMSHDLDPAVMTDGRVVFSRWDRMGGVNRVNLYSMNPDGSKVQILYGAHSHSRSDRNNQLEWYQPQQADNGQLLVQLSEVEPELWSTQFKFVDAENYTDINMPVYANSGAVGSGHTAVNGLAGQLAHASPLYDGTGRILAVWSPCRLLIAGGIQACTPEALATPDATPASPIYGLWLFDPALGTQTLVQAGTSVKIAVEAVVMAARTPPPVITSYVASSQYDAAAASEDLGILDVRSIYDFAGVDTATGGLGALADPLQSSFEDRRGVFLRIVKGVPVPGRDIKQLNNADFGVSQQQLMREIIGYVPVEPDGSVKAAIPARVPFAISLVNASGVRVGGRHQNWLQLQPGEVLACNGCHQNGNDKSVHGRIDAEPPSANPGSALNSAFPNTQPGLIAQIGETMAQVWARINGSPRPAVDLEFDDRWTDPNVASAIASFAVRHDDLATAKPLSPACIDIDGNAAWSPLCRIQIHYPTHIEPLWSMDRTGLAADGVTPEDRTCISCHSRTDAFGALTVPAGQLELSSEPSPQMARQSISYRELLLNDNEVEVRDGALQDVLVQQLDADGNPVPVLDEDGEPVLDPFGNPVYELTTRPVTRSMNPAGAAASSRFFNTMTQAGTTVDHREYLTEAELLLIREWLDIGAQYYNDPFAVP